MIERWLDVIGYEGFYRVSDKGRVLSLTRKVKHSGNIRLVQGRFLKPIPDKDGYLRVHLSKDGIRIKKRIHILVCEAFLGTKPYKHQVCHGVLGRTDNTLENLRWGTSQDNSHDRRQHGEKFSSKYQGVAWASDRNKWRAYVLIKGAIKHLGSHNTEEEAAIAVSKFLSALVVTMMGAGLVRVAGTFARPVFI